MQVSKSKLAMFGGLAAVVILTGFAFRPKPVPVETAQAVFGPMMTTVDEDARTRVQERYEISSPIAGRHLRVEVHPGDPVKRGDPLVIVEAAPLDPRQREELQARLGAAEDLAREAAAVQRRVEVLSAQAERDRVRIEKMAASGIASASDREQARTTAADRRRELQAAQSRANAAAHDAAVIRASLSATNNGGEFAIASPIDGRVLNVQHESEGVIAAGAPILEVGNPAPLEVVIDVLSHEAPRVNLGQKVIIDGWGGDTPLSAIVSRIEPSAFTKISALGIEEQRVNVIAMLHDPPPALGDRFEVQARVVTWSGSTLKVPSTAVFRSGNGWAVFTVRGGRARLQAIEVAHRNADEVEVTSGLSRGTDVIVHPSDQIRAGVRVKVERG